MERNPRSQKPHLSFIDYCKMIEELLILTKRKIPARKKISSDGFKL